MGGGSTHICIAQAVVAAAAHHWCTDILIIRNMWRCIMMYCHAIHAVVTPSRWLWVAGSQLF
jgi:hypothetical protein